MIEHHVLFDSEPEEGYAEQEQEGEEAQEVSLVTAHLMHPNTWMRQLGEEEEEEKDDQRAESEGGDVKDDEPERAVFKDFTFRKAIGKQTFTLRF